MKPTDNQPQRPAAPTAAVDPAKKKKKNKRVANVVVVIMGVLLYVDLFAQPGCDDSTGGTGNAIDAASFDAPSIDAPTIDSPVVVPPDDSGQQDAPSGDCWAAANGTVYKGNLGCSIGSTSTFSVSMVDGTVYKLSPFGQQTGGQEFFPKAGAPNEATVQSVTINQMVHSCTLTCVPGTPKPTLSLTCLRASDQAMCTELFPVAP